MSEPIMHLTRKDFEWSYFRVGGSGGQHRDKTSAGVRCTHPPSGAVGQASDSRSQWKNKQTAFRRCAESAKFVAWVNFQHARITGDIDRAVKELMRPENLLIEPYAPQ